MKISILTICPEMLGSILQDHVIGRAVSLDRLTLNIVDIRNFAEGSFRQVDDSPYGGGRGMILRIDPVMQAVRSVTRPEEKTCTAAFSPAGSTFCQKDAADLIRFDHLILICGHYEGMDARIYSHCDRLISLGDFILSGGEIPAMAVTDAAARLLPGVLKEGSLSEESFNHGLLEYPQYTRPADYHGEKVPDVLLSGNHEAIRRWRQEEALRLTRALRPDLIAKEQDPSGA